MNQDIKLILEAGMLAAAEPLSAERLQQLFSETERPALSEVKNALVELANDYANRSFELKELASGYCIRVKEEFSPWIGRLWEERPPKYSRALLETLALIAYRQPITRGEIEKVRGVAVNSLIIKTLLDRNWIRIVGQRDVPGKPSLFATTKEFLDYFSLKSLQELPSLAEIKDLEQIGEQLELGELLQSSLPDGESTDVTTETNTLAEETVVADELVDNHS